MFSIPNIQSIQTYPLLMSEEIKNFNKTLGDVQGLHVSNQKKYSLSTRKRYSNCYKNKPPVFI